MDTPTPAAAAVRPLEREEIHALLARNHVGRIAYARGTRLDIEPIHYVYSDGWLYGRASRGAKLDTSGESWWPVAFEVDEVDGPLDWRSVVVHGGFYTLRPEERWQQEDYARAVERLRTLAPGASDAEGAVPMDVVFRIAVQEVSGRASRAPACPGAAGPALAPPEVGRA
jgi:uncharacterized protein